jgi:hypothetical protein
MILLHYEPLGAPEIHYSGSNQSSDVAEIFLLLWSRVLLLLK